MELSQSLRKCISSGRLAGDVGEVLAERVREKEREERERKRKRKRKGKRGTTAGEGLVI